MRAAVALALLCLACTPALAQHLSERKQWQPQVMPADPRLDQRVEIEILGRAAVPALEILSEATGVSLGVAPENLGTVGERKLTVIANDISLRAIMVQIPEALQEAHWDVFDEDGQRAYVLHRNGGVEHTMDWLIQRDEERRADRKRRERVARMQLGRRALEMSSEELAELEETDPLMALSVQDPHSRDLLEILLTLPPEQAEEFRATGRLTIPYYEAPERLRSAMQRVAEWFVERHEEEDLPSEVRNWPDNLDHANISIQDHSVEHGWGVWVALDIPNERGYPVIHDVALQPKYCNLDEGQTPYTRLLVATGAPDEEAAFEMVVQRDKEGFRAAAAARERHERGWDEPTDPELLQTVVVGDKTFDSFAEFYTFIAAETGLSVVSDYFTLRGPHVGKEHRQGIPLWRLLYLAGEDTFQNRDVYVWEKVGSCLVFHRADWAALARAEIPEWLIADYRSRLEEQGELTLDDVAELAITLEGRDLPGHGLPRALARAALGINAGRWAPLLYATLTPDQKERVASPAGLPFAGMTLAQQRAVRDRAANRAVAVPAGSAEDSVFRLATLERESHGRHLEITELQLHFGEFVDSVMVGLKIREQAAGRSGSY